MFITQKNSRKLLKSISHVIIKPVFKKLMILFWQLLGHFVLKKLHTLHYGKDFRQHRCVNKLLA